MTAHHFSLNIPIILGDIMGSDPQTIPQNVKLTTHQNNLLRFQLALALSRQAEKAQVDSEITSSLAYCLLVDNLVEFFNNARSELATTLAIFISTSKLANTLLITIMDNGKGFKPEAFQNQGIKTVETVATALTTQSILSYGKILSQDQKIISAKTTANNGGHGLALAQVYKSLAETGGDLFVGNCRAGTGAIVSLSSQLSVKPKKPHLVPIKSVNGEMKAHPVQATTQTRDAGFGELVAKRFGIKIPTPLVAQENSDRTIRVEYKQQNHSKNNIQKLLAARKVDIREYRQLNNLSVFNNRRRVPQWNQYFTKLNSIRKIRATDTFAPHPSTSTGNPKKYKKG